MPKTFFKIFIFAIGREHPNIPSELTLKLKNFYKPFDEELFKLLDTKPFW